MILDFLKRLPKLLWSNRVFVLLIANLLLTYNVSEIASDAKRYARWAYSSAEDAVDAAEDAESTASDAYDAARRAASYASDASDYAQQAEYYARQVYYYK